MNIKAATKRFICRNQDLFKVRKLRIDLICREWAAFLEARKGIIDFDVTTDFPIKDARPVIRVVIGKVKS